MGPVLKGDTIVRRLRWNPGIILTLQDRMVAGDQKTGSACDESCGDLPRLEETRVTPKGFAESDISFEPNWRARLQPRQVNQIGTIHDPIS